MTTNVGKTTKQLIQDTARKIAREPLEILKESQRQALGPETSQEAKIPEPSTQAPVVEEMEDMEKESARRKYEVLQNELREIERARVFNETQRKIAKGKDVYWEDLTELTSEQKEVLKAQEEAQKLQRESAKTEGGAPQVSGKRPRGFLFGPRLSAQKQQTRVEKILPPAG